MNALILWQHTVPPLLKANKAAALMQVSSLTVALRALGYGFSVRLLHLGAVTDDGLLTDGLAGGLDSRANWFARDVLLCLDDRPVVWARSLCAHSALQWRTLLDCGTRPLGERLFDGSLPLVRSAFEYAALGEDTGLVGFDGKAFAARRSFFNLHGEVLGLVECFLPELDDYLVHGIE